MNVLITNIWLVNQAGTEVGVRDLAIALQKRGHHVEVYSPSLGVVAREIREAGIHIVDSVQDLVAVPDIIHAQHFTPSLDAMLKFPGIPAVYVLHDRTHPADTPPKINQVVKYYAVDYNCLDRLVLENKIDESNTGVIYNWVDTERFKMREHIAPKPLKALVFSNYAKKDNYYHEIKIACNRMNIQLDAIGLGFGNAVIDPENVLLKYDLVFAKAKAAMEALATGAGVILCDKMGLGGFVIPEHFENYRKYNCGMRILVHPVEADRIVEEIKKYNTADIATAARLIREDASFPVYVDRILRIYSDAIASYKEKPGIWPAEVENATLREYFIQKENLHKKERNQLMQEIREMARLNEDLGKKIQSFHLNGTHEFKTISKNLEKIKGSLSYKIGRMMTAPVRFVYERLNKKR
jgi:glycosyltransferase involved in cell wall biosynthesis